MAGHQRTTAKETGDADSAGTIAVSNTGIINGGVNVTLPRTPRSGYLHQVEAIAAVNFRGREKELSALASFCSLDIGSGSQGGKYWRWLAPAWAGKSALMAHFALNPPASVDVISFFITARLAGQSDRVAFCEVVQRQIYALLGEEEPLTTPSTRDEQLRLALDRAAEFCSRQGRRLVLVVDGLDEDRGVTAGSESYSIAALLPRFLKYGMRVILAGRPHPPVPDDVPADHPLRDSSIDHWLEVSPHAQAVRHEAERDLLRLLDGGGLGRELVGLVATAGGGLSAHSLADLTGSRTRLVERELSAVSGRSFRRRTSHWAPRPTDTAEGAREVVYLLAHEELQTCALDLLTHDELENYRQRLHSWADRYRHLSWPQDTPEYLLRGYMQFLRESCDIKRVLVLAGDQGRHERLWQVSGSDLEALNEISAAFEQVLSETGESADIEIEDFVLLALGRDYIHDQTGNLPRELISLWAHFGDFDRSINLAYAQGVEYKRSMALTSVARALARLGRTELVMEIAYALARTRECSSDMAKIAETLAVEGHRESALDLVKMIARPEKVIPVRLALARSQHSLRGEGVAEDLVEECISTAMALTDVYERGNLIAAVAGTLAATGYPEKGSATAERAASLAEAANEEYRTAQSLAGIARALVSMNVLLDESRDMALRAARKVEGIRDPDERTWALRLVTSALAETCQGDYAIQLCVHVLNDPGELGRALAALGTELAKSGQHGMAISAVNDISNKVYPGEKAQAFAAIAESLAKAGQRSRAAEFAGQALQIAETLPDSWKIDVSVSAAWALFHAGLEVQSRELAQKITNWARKCVNSRAQIGKLSAVAKALGGTGYEDLSSALLRRAVEIVDTMPTRYAMVLNLADVAVASQGAESLGLLGRALMIVEEDLHPTERCEALAVIAIALSEIGQKCRASEIAAVAVTLSQLSDSPHQREWDAASAVRALSAAHDFDSAREIAVTLTDYEVISMVGQDMASRLAGAGQISRAYEVMEEIPDERYKDRALFSIACALISNGERDRILEVATSFDSAIMADKTLVRLAGALSGEGEHGRAIRIVEDIGSAELRGEALGAIAQAFGPTVQGRRYLARALSLTRWDSLISAIQVVSPQGLDAVAGHLMTSDAQL